MPPASDIPKAKAKVRSKSKDSSDATKSKGAQIERASSVRAPTASSIARVRNPSATRSRKGGSGAAEPVSNLFPEGYKPTFSDEEADEEHKRREKEPKDEGHSPDQSSESAVVVPSASSLEMSSGGSYPSQQFPDVHDMDSDPVTTRVKCLRILKR